MLRFTLAGLLLAAAPAAADEGMWTFDKLPLAGLAQRHQFTPPPGWVDHLLAASVRLAQGCSASFISPAGLVLSNHHCARDCATGLSSADHDLMKSGFLAASLAEERRCPDLEVDRLEAITTVTDRVHAATAGSAGEAFHTAERSVIAAIEQDCTTGAEMRCQVVTLFHGAVYDLYRYRRFQDVRLVFVPEEAAASYADATTADWPLHALDMSLFRVYAGDQPLDTRAGHLAMAAAPAKPGDLVFVAGNPGTTDRLETVAQLEELRDVDLPIGMADFSVLRGIVVEAAGETPELAREVNFLAFITELVTSRLRSQHQALTIGPLMADKRRAEAAFRARVAADPAQASAFGGAWDAIGAAMDHQRDIAARYLVLEREPRFAGLLHMAVLLVRHAAEAPKPNGERLEEYADANLPALTAEILSPAPVYPEIEVRTLAWLLSRLPANLGSNDPAVEALLGHDSPQDVAARLVSGSKLADPAARKALFEGGSVAIAASDDALIGFVRDHYDAQSRAVRRDYENHVEAVVTANAALIDQARYAAYGDTAYPDATFTPRLAFGVVGGYTTAAGVTRPAVTTIGEAFGLQTGRDPFALPQSWNDAREALDPATPLDVATTADIVGGNSGSPLVDRDGKLAGLIFAGNDAAEANTFGYEDRESRAIAVMLPAIQAALQHVYHADRLLEEMAAP